MTNTGRSELLSALFVVAVFAVPGVAVAQYKYIGPDGRTTYSDLPPPPGVRVIETRRSNATPVTANPPLPFELQAASSKYPVTLYTGDKCAPCDE